MTKSEILAMFVAKNDIRSYLMKPALIGEYVYASNGHWIVRIPAAEAQAEACESESFIKNAPAVFEKAKQENFIPLPAQPEPVKCHHCKGTGMGTGGDCESCEGDGEFYHHDHYYECKSCDGDGCTFQFTRDGKDECPYCDGSGYEIGRDSTIAFGDSSYASRYLYRLSLLPGIEIATAGDAAARFRFEGIEGLLMPVRA